MKTLLAALVATVALAGIALPGAAGAATHKVAHEKARKAVAHTPVNVSAHRTATRPASRVAPAPRPAGPAPAGRGAHVSHDTTGHASRVRASGHGATRAGTTPATRHAGAARKSAARHAVHARATRLQ
ncbi:hypothetical protein [Derxia gummosa]|uniref:Uncharacterized protein n=1 Tax=Derxia gummosa DSM 723 TaxID=1121388 RepID=A0A8B6X4S4_9BURK|nr:hypothetical protein [Derxia gummosa]